MTHHRLVPSRPALCALAGISLLLALLALAGAASAKRPHLRSGHLPAIGAIELIETKGGRATITVPVAYTQALSGRPAAGLESAEVTLRIGRVVKRRRAVGVKLTRTHRHRISGTGTILDRFRLGRQVSQWLLSRPRKDRGRLVRVDVRHRIKERRNEPPLHEKAASLDMASSHQARPQGEAAALTVRNATAQPIRLASEPILCMYTNGEGGSNLQAFTTPAGEPILPGGTIEAKVEGSANALVTAAYQGGTGEGAGNWFDWEGIALDAITNAFDVELTPVFLGLDLAEHCDAQASTFMLVAANQSGRAATSGSWVLTDETCRMGCVDNHMPSAAEALEVQGVGEEQVNQGVWAHDSTEVLKALVGGWRDPPAGGKIVQDQGLHWTRQERAEVEEEEWWFVGEEAIQVPVKRRAWELSIQEGSSPAGYSG